jgi:hypothetical protein
MWGSARPVVRNTTIRFFQRPGFFNGMNGHIFNDRDFSVTRIGIWHP